MCNFEKLWHLQPCDQKLLSQSNDSNFPFYFQGNKKLPFWVKDPNPLIELEEFNPCWDWLNIFCNSFNCSLLNRPELDGVGLYSMVTWCSRISLSFWGRDGFQYASFPWIFQYVSLLWLGFRQWLHQGLLFLGRLSLERWRGPRDTRAEP